MNIMVISSRPQEVQGALLKSIGERCPDGQQFFVVGFKEEAEGSLLPLFDLDTQNEPNKHAIIVANDIRHLWQGMRQLLDVVIEIKSTDAEEWIVQLLLR